MKEVERICRDIRSIKIQGATNIAKAALRAYSLSPTLQTKKKLISLRPTEPLLVNTLMQADRIPQETILAHFSEAQDAINRAVYRLLKGKKTVYTHCHSTNVIKALVYARTKGRTFSVCNTETRPLYQGRKTATDLARAGITVRNFVDSAMDIALKESDIVLIGADAILSGGIINKVGSGAISKLARLYRVPLYIIADSWKYSPRAVKIEERDFHEVWENVPARVSVKNPAFEKVEKKYITGIVSEYGVLPYGQFIKKVQK